MSACVSTLETRALLHMRHTARGSLISSLRLKGSCDWLRSVELVVYVFSFRGIVSFLVNLVSWCCRNMRFGMRRVRGVDPNGVLNRTQSAHGGRLTTCSKASRPMVCPDLEVSAAHAGPHDHQTTRRIRSASRRATSWRSWTYLVVGNSHSSDMTEGAMYHF